MAKIKAANDNGRANSKPEFFIFEQRASLLIEGDRTGIIDYFIIFNDEDAFMARYPHFADKYRQQRLARELAAIQPDVA